MLLFSVRHGCGIFKPPARILNGMLSAQKMSRMPWTSFVYRAAESTIETVGLLGF